METNKQNLHEDEPATRYDAPEIVDYGTLVELTEAGNLANSDVPFGDPNTAFPSHPS